MLFHKAAAATGIYSFRGFCEGVVGEGFRLASLKAVRTGGGLQARLPSSSHFWPGKW